MSILVNFLKNNPEVLAAYVVVSTKLVDRLVSPLNKFMEHLLVVQDIDPNTQPGENFRKALAVAIEGVDDANDFQDDFDLVARHHQKTIRGLAHLNLSRDKFLKITDLSKLNDPPKSDTEVNRVAPELAKKETPVYTAEDIATFNKMAEGKTPFLSMEEAQKAVVEDPAKYSSFSDKHLKASSLKEALEVLSKYAHLLETPNPEKPQDETVDFDSTRHDRARAHTAIGVSKKTNSGYSRVAKIFGKGLFRRVNEQFEPKK